MKTTKLMKIKKIFLGLSCALLFIVAGFAKDVYISPNNDGTQDELIIPLSIKDKRYISEWELVIQDDKENVVKRMGNKNRSDDSADTFFRGLTSGDGAKAFFKNVGSAFAPKKGVDVPSVVRWNGVMDNGEVAPDGKYSYFFRAADDNGNFAQSKSHYVIVDSTVPQIAVVQPSESAKIFGSGSKPVLSIKQSGSKEDLWKGTISDSSGNVVKTFIWEDSEPLSIEWDGQDDSGNHVNEGVYSYQVTATDKAGNTSRPAGVNNIIYDAIPRTASINLEGSPFSPGTSSKKSNLAIKIDVPNQNGMTEWKIQVLDAKNKAVKTWSGVENVPANISFDGRDDNGSIIADGDYTFALNVDYNNGQNPKSSMKFAVDTKAPFVNVACDSDMLSPDNDGNKDTIAFSQSGSKESLWQAYIVRQDGTIVKTWNFVGLPPENLVWNGIGDDKKLATPGIYYYEISSTDEAGNEFVSDKNRATFTLDVSKTYVVLHQEYDAFSPNTESSHPALALVPIVKSESGVESYKLEVKDAKGKIVKTWSDEANVPSVFEWNGLDDEGKRCEDGTYSISLRVTSKNGNVTSTSPQSVVIDRKAPEIAKFNVDYTIFNPNGDGKKDEVKFDIKTSTEDVWKVSIKNEKGKEVVQKVWTKNPVNFAWDGTDSNGSKLIDGNYTVELSSTDAAGNTTSASNIVSIDTRPVKAFITAENEAFSPLATGKKENQLFTIMATPSDGIESWSVSIMANDGKVVKEWSTATQEDLPESISWNGVVSTDKDGNPVVANGSYIAKMDIVYAKGDEISSSTSSFICVANEPSLKVQTAPKYFSPDNDGLDDDLFIKLKCESVLPLSSWKFEVFAPGEKENEKGPLFWKVGGDSTVTDRLTWDGWSNVGKSERVQSATDYRYEFTVSDSIGLTSKVEGVIPVDVLVIRDGDLLKIQIPSIVFRSNAADFGVVGEKLPDGSVITNGLTKEQKANNEKVLKRIAEILNKFKEYNIVIEGHANNISGTLEEGEKDIPLSEKRAEFVKSRLVKYGISSSRLETVGRGGTQPIVVPGNDPNTAWKNRRVEFILQK